MYGELLLQEANERHEQLIRDAQTLRRALRSRKVEQASSILKGLIIFLISVF